MAYITSLRPEFVTTTNLMNHILIVWKSYTALPIRDRQIEKKNFLIRIHTQKRHPLWLLLPLNEKKETARRKWTEALCIHYFLPFPLESFLFLPLIMRLSHFPIIASSRFFSSDFSFSFKNGKNTWVTLKHQYNEKTRSLLFEVCLMDCMF